MGHGAQWLLVVQGLQNGVGLCFSHPNGQGTTLTAIAQDDNGVLVDGIDRNPSHMHLDHEQLPPAGDLDRIYGRQSLATHHELSW